jgi:diadenosine tetraphosphate (Ap4A) HIT family hydrolase
MSLLAPAQCPFCQRVRDGIVVQHHAAIAFSDGFLVSRGHLLIIPKRHVANILELAPAELDDVWQLVSQVCDHLSVEPDRAAPLLV